MRHVVVGLMLLSCTHDPDPPPAPPAEPPAAAPAPVKMAPAGDRGTCTLKATGAFAAEQTSHGESGTVSSKYWLADGEHGAAGDAALTVNCTGKDLRVSFTSKPDATVPFSAKTYAITPKTGDLLVLGRAGKGLADWSGSIDVTAFDGHHVAGTLALTAKQQGGGTVTFEGTFDFRCQGGNCAH